VELTKSFVGKAVESTTFQFTSRFTSYDLFKLLSERLKLLYFIMYAVKSRKLFVCFLCTSLFYF